MFTVALFIIARTWTQPKCPSTEESIKKMWYRWNIKLLSHKKNEIVLFTEMWMGLETVLQSKVSQSDKNRYNINTYM